MTDLKALKVGDAVAYDIGRRVLLDRVVSISATGRIRTERQEWNPDGEPRGYRGSSWDRPGRLRPARDEDREAYERNRLIRARIGFNWDKLTLDQLRRIDAICKETAE